MASNFAKILLTDKGAVRVGKCVGQTIKHCYTYLCNKITNHDIHEDDDGNKYHVCKTCGKHNNR